MTTEICLRRLALALVLGLTGLSPAQATTTLVAAGSTWRYLDDGSGPGGAWAAPSFNDAAWSAGPAQLGYGDGDEATVTSSAPSKPVTAYFRKTFPVANAATLGTLTLSLLRDDGAVVYINGQEVFRSNMAAGTVTSATLAASVVNGTAETARFTTTLPPSVLVSGTNVVAVELHQADAASTDASFDLSLIAGTGPAVTRGPYLQRASSSGIVVRWRTDHTTNSSVRYGPDPAQLAQSASSVALVAEHEVTLSNLVPGATYYYAVGTSNGSLSGPDEAHRFAVPPPEGVAAPARIWVLGDSGHATVGQQAVRSAFVRFTAAHDANLILTLGDNAYETGTDAEYQSGLFDAYRDELLRLPLWPAFGNHDASSSDANLQTGPYFSAFTLPRNGEAGGFASGTEAYYSFDYANVHFVCLNSSGGSSRLLGGAMLNWLDADLAATSQKWIVAYWHHPPYSRGSHDSDVESRDIDMRNNAVKLLEQHGVDLVLGGHSHAYERSYLIDGHYGLSTTFTTAMKKNGGSGRVAETGAYVKPNSGSASHAGTVYAVAGSSSSTEGGKLNHPAMFLSLNRLGSMVIDVNGLRLDAFFVDDSGVVRDSFTIDKSGTLPTVPAAPTALAATTTSSSAIRLDWQDRSTNETGFSIERAGAGTSFTTVATVGANTVSWTNAGLAAGTAYQYRVRAGNGAGFSAYSNTATATTAGGASTGTLVPFGAAWKYRDDGSNQGTAWRAIAFDDSAWAVGVAQLGFGDGDEATVVPRGPASGGDFVTTYFRRSFTVADPSQVTSLALSLLYDDGGVVYLNGTEVLRANMPAGAIAFSTLASSGAENKSVTVNVAAALLRAGANELAVEVHQNDLFSSDLSFDLRVVAQ